MPANSQDVQGYITNQSPESIVEEAQGKLTELEQRIKEAIEKNAQLQSLELAHADQLTKEKIEELNKTREEQIQKKQKILEELQKVERELQLKTQQQLKLPFRSFQLTQLGLFTISYCNLISLLYFNHCDYSTAKCILCCLGGDWPGWVCSLPSVRRTHTGFWNLISHSVFWGNYPDHVSNVHSDPYATNERALWKQTSDLPSTDGRINYVADTVTEIIS